MSNVTNYIKAGYPLIWIETFEESRALLSVVSEISRLASLSDEQGNSIEFRTYTWDCADGIREIGVKDNKLTFGAPITKKVSDAVGTVEMPTNEPLDPLQWLDLAPENTVLFLKDYHSALDQSRCPDSFRVIRKIRNLVPKFKSLGKTMIILSPLVKIPEEIEKECHKMSFPLPGREELIAVLEAVCKSNSIKYPKKDTVDMIIDAARGLTSVEAENAFAVSIVETAGGVLPEIVRREKTITVEKTGLLEVVNTSETLDTVGGNENLKEWIQKSMTLVGEEARAFRARPPKGVLLVGVPGCGKSLSAAVIASISNRPLLRFDVGKVYDKYQGESEARIRRCLAIAEAVAPCVLWIDELEKSLAGARGSETDHGTSGRIFSTLLTWLQERKADVFIVATANDVSRVPAELYRPGRIDAAFWLGLPDEAQRAEILKIHLKKLGRSNLFSENEIKQLASVSENFSGAAIEAWVQSSINHAFVGRHEVTIQDFLDTVHEITVTDMSDSVIRASIEWARKNKVRMASRPSQTEPIAKSFGDRRVNL